MPISLRRKKSQKEKGEVKKSVAKAATSKEVADRGTAQKQKKDGATDDTPPQPSSNAYTTKNHDKNRATTMGGSLQYSPNDQIEDMDAPFDEALVDGAHVKKVAIIANGADDDADNTAEKGSVVEADMNKNSAFLGKRFSGKASQKATKTTSKAPFFRRKSKKLGSDIEEEEKEIDKIDASKHEEEPTHKEKLTTNLKPITGTGGHQQHDSTRDAVAKSNDAAASKCQTNDDITTTDDETDTSTTINEGTTSCSNIEPPSPLGGCACVPSKEDVAHKIDEAVFFLDKIVAPKLALAFLCLAPEEESVELGYQENTGRHRSSRRSRRNGHRRERSVSETPKKNNAIKLE